MSAGTENRDAPAPAMAMTLRRPVSCSGCGLHGGEHARLTLHPVPPGSGLAFLKDGVTIPVRADHVVETRRRVSLGRDGITVATVEHLLAASVGLGLDDALFELSGPELPALDGSALLFAELILEAGLAATGRPRQYFRPGQRIVVENGPGWLEGGPDAGSAPDSLVLDCRIDFPGRSLPPARLVVEIDPVRFLRELAPARTFCFWDEVRGLWEAGLALGGELSGTLVLDGEGLPGPAPRFADEAVRHKLLDLLGDLALLGAVPRGRFRGCRGGHALHLAWVRKALSLPDA